MALRLAMDRPSPDVVEVWLEVEGVAVPSGTTTWERVEVIGTGRSEWQARLDASLYLRTLMDYARELELPTP